MAENEWKIAKVGAACGQCGAAFACGQGYYSTLVEEAAGLQRRDLCHPCFQHQPGTEVYYFWKSSYDPSPPKTPRRPQVDPDAVLDFFKHLENESAPQKVAFRFVLALMLTRKKVLVLEGRRRANDTEVQIFKERRGGALHTVVEPILSPEELEQVSAELGALLGLPSGQTQPAGAAPASETASPDGQPAGQTQEDGPI